MTRGKRKAIERSARKQRGMMSMYKGFYAGESTGRGNTRKARRSLRAVMESIFNRKKGR